MKRKTTVAKSNRGQASWYVVDASQETLGRMAAQIARMLMGKHKPTYTPHVDTGDYIVVINAADVQLTGAKKDKKIYRRHTGHPGGLVETPYSVMRERHPEDIVRLAVRRMLPKTNLGRDMLRKLKVYGDDRHEHHAQNPQPLSFGSGKE